MHNFKNAFRQAIPLSGLAIIMAPAPAYAYLDPGTGSIILQGLLGGLAAVAVVSKIYWHRLLMLLGLRRDQSSEEGQERHD